MAAPGKASGNIRLAVVGLALAVIGLALSVTVTMRGYRTQQQQAERLAVVRDSLRAVCDSLRVELDKAETHADDQSKVNAWEHRLPPILEDLRNRAVLLDPEQALRSDLLRHRELIPIRGTQGATMKFSEDEIRILDDNWVYAQFNDGHTRGATLLEYEITDEGIRWKWLTWH